MIGKTPDADQFFVLNYDGEFSTHSGFAVAAGSDVAETAMREVLQNFSSTPTLEDALARAKDAWRAGMKHRVDEDESGTHSNDPLEEALESAHIEVAILQRDTPRESKFRLLTEQELS